MADNPKPKKSGSITCPYCGAPGAGAFTRVEEQDDAGPSKILYKCNGCGMFYTAERVITWRVKKT
jgi:DNA-directed RNA polymerase subunit RPC12/RpoP